MVAQWIVDKPWLSPMSKTARSKMLSSFSLAIRWFYLNHILEQSKPTLVKVKTFAYQQVFWVDRFRADTSSTLLLHARGQSLEFQQRQFRKCIDPSGCVWHLNHSHRLWWQSILSEVNVAILFDERTARPRCHLISSLVREQSLPSPAIGVDYLDVSA